MRALEGRHYCRLSEEQHIDWLDNRLATWSVAVSPNRVDTAAQFGQSYQYALQALVGEAVSLRGQFQTIVPLDTFPPAAPVAVTAIPGPSSVELAWEPNSEPDAATYRVYRAAGDAPMSLAADNVATPSYRDTKTAAGVRYRYHVTALDARGNESPPSAIVEVEAQ